MFKNQEEAGPGHNSGPPTQQTHIIQDQYNYKRSFFKTNKKLSNNIFF